MPPARPLAAAALLCALAACGATRAARTLVNDVREESLTGRCADVMQRAFPGGEIEVTRQETVPEQTQSIATSVIAVEGTRKLARDSTLLREVAVECRFNDGILTGFRWTKGPLR